ncbi:hypothetical protein BT67DRAFT_235491 [Trichocladium antarcticum]|uniref:Uncharacterized protein n=1 Tax=Trichocladium antarcticum TaxID=1450529 RepID=A0AAN6UNV4_9PEZI|nr:hypothetical protein BT67DRAFT_235491 [Trichocladium antarcticum]
MSMATMDTASHLPAMPSQACLLRGNRCPLVNWQCLTFPSRAVFPTGRGPTQRGSRECQRVPSMARECCRTFWAVSQRATEATAITDGCPRFKIRHSNSRGQHTAAMETMYKHIYTHKQHPARHCLTCHKRGSPQRNPRIQNAAADQKAPTSRDYNQPRIAPT